MFKWIFVEDMLDFLSLCYCEKTLQIKLKHVQLFQNHKTDVKASRTKARTHLI